MNSVFSMQRLRTFPTIIWVMLIGNFFVRGTFFMVWPFLAVILYKKFNLTATQVGIILSSSALCSTFIGLYVGNLSDRIGRKPFMLAATFLGAIAFTLLAFAHTLALFVFAVFLASLPRGLWIAPSKALVGDVLTNPKDRELALQCLYFMINAGGVIGPAVGVWIGLTGEQFSFIYTAIAYAGLSVAILKVFTKASGISAKQQKNTTSFKQTLAILMTDHKFLVIIVANILVMFVYAHINTSLLQYLTRLDVPHLVQLISIIVIANSAIIVGFQFILLKLMENLTILTRINIGVFLMAISQLMFAFNPIDFYAGWIIAVIVLSFAEVILFSNMSVHIDRLAPAKLRGSYFGAANLYSLGFAAGPIIGGIVLDTWGGPMLYQICFVICLGVFMLYYLSRYLKRPNFEPEEADTGLVAKPLP